jgi:hypothetical protein
MARVVMTRRSGSRRPLPHPHRVDTPRQPRQEAVGGRGEYGEQILDEMSSASHLLLHSLKLILCSDLIFVSNFGILSKPSVCLITPLPLAWRLRY